VSTAEGWTTPDDVRAEVERLWSGGRLLAAVLETIGAGSSEQEPVHPERRITFPRRLRLRAPPSATLGTSFEAVRSWVKALESGSRTEVGSGYEVTWRETRTKQLGRNRLPHALILPTLDDALALINRRADAELFAELAATTVSRFPGLAGWLTRKPLAVLEHRSEWRRILAVLEWFACHPRSGLYLRQIDVPGVDTKFIERREALLGELLDVLSPPPSSDGPTPAEVGTFEARYGLAQKPALIRFRLLDPGLAISGVLSDLTARVTEFAMLNPKVERVFVVENEVTGLSFPEFKRAMLIFGSGYALERLAAVEWLRSLPVAYWGDIDTHGFAMLDRLRGFLPQTRSLLMDRATLLAHREQWAVESAPYIGELSRLSPEEAALFDDLRFARLGDGVRLEQERVLFSFAERTIEAQRCSTHGSP